MDGDNVAFNGIGIGGREEECERVGAVDPGMSGFREIAPEEPC